MTPFFGVECVYQNIEEKEIVIPVIEENMDIVDTGYE